MNQIEVTCSEKTDENILIKNNDKLFPSPGINWSWWEASKGQNLGELERKIVFEEPKTIWDAFGNKGTYLPHAFPFIFGLLFFFIYPRICSNINVQANKTLQPTAKSDD